jgi:hypothetical protein
MIGCFRTTTAFKNTAPGQAYVSRAARCWLGCGVCVERVNNGGSCPFSLVGQAVSSLTAMSIVPQRQLISAAAWLVAPGCRRHCVGMEGARSFIFCMLTEALVLTLQV